MKFKNARTAVAVVVLVVFALCIALGATAGTWCGFGPGDIALLCPVGALLSMVAAKTLIPRAVVSLVVVVVLVLLVGRAFCGWLCPVTLWRRVKEFFSPVKKREAAEAALSAANQELAACEIEAAKGGAAAAMAAAAVAGDPKAEAAVTADELGAKAREVAKGGKATSHVCATCGACGKRNATLNSRHAVLGGALLTTAVFGFPVFCLVCPVGLSFAAIALLIGLFGAGDLNWGLVFVPAMLIIELVFLRKWCGRFCPISAFMSLFSRFGRTGMPVIDNEKCLETSKGIACSRCATVCTFDVNLRHPDLGELPLHDCARCGDCIDACPAQAISLRAVSGKPEAFADAFQGMRKEKAAPAAPTADAGAGSQKA